jgi:hypothetical protein
MGGPMASRKRQYDTETLYAARCGAEAFHRVPPVTMGQAHLVIRVPFFFLVAVFCFVFFFSGRCFLFPFLLSFLFFIFSITYFTLYFKLFIYKNVQILRIVHIISLHLIIFKSNNIV